MKRAIVYMLIFLGVGLVATLASSIALFVCADFEKITPLTGQSSIGSTQQLVTRWDHWGAVRIQSTRMRVTGYAPQQAAGPPDTPPGLDTSSAWASMTPDSQPEWLILYYEKPVVAREIQVHETHGPGAIHKVSIFDSADREIVVWEGVDPTPTSEPAGISYIPVTDNTVTRKVKLYIDSMKVPSWNEVDAVALVDDQGTIQWAQSAEASSTYAARYYYGASFPASELIPAWSRLSRESKPLGESETDVEGSMSEARGWPMLVLLKEGATPANPNYYAYSPWISPSATYAGSTENSLPMGIIWNGLAVNSVVLGALCYAIWLMLMVPRRFVLEVSRFRRGRCIQCGYDLRYDFIPGCPECGWRRDRQQEQSDVKHQQVKA